MSGRAVHLRSTQVRLHMHHQFARVEGLGHIVVAAGRKPYALIHDVAFRRQKDDRRLHTAGAHRSAGGKAIHLRHHHIEDDEVKRLCRDLRERLGAVFGAYAHMAFVFEHSRNQLLDARLVIDNQNLHSKSSSSSGMATYGMRTQKVLPTLRRDSTVARPPCNSVSSLTTASPKPVPR